MTETTPEFDALKSKLKTVWDAGDYGRVARDLEASAEEFLSRIPIEAGSDVLDLACGSGQIALPAARAGARVTGVDIAPSSLEQGRERAAAEGFDIQFDEGDAEELPYADGSFDLVISLIGAMFAPRPDRVAAEMVRVCRPGGRIVMGNWTPEGFIGKMLKTVGQHVPPPDMPSPLLWGDTDTVTERLSDGIADLQLTERIYPFRYAFPPVEVADYYFQFYGPTNKAYGALDDDGKSALHAALTDLWADHNTATDGTTDVGAEILEVVAVRA
ncbi:MAG: class I SAM-dependent methyltransferase [Nitrospiraceae bacterium]|jgi:SAM-dependent methyltransferase